MSLFWTMYFTGHTNIHGPYDRSPLDPGRNTLEAIKGTFPSSFSNMYRSGNLDTSTTISFSLKSRLSDRIQSFEISQIIAEITLRSNVSLYFD